MSQLAIHGGKPAVTGPLPKYRSMGEREKELVLKVIEDDCLSGFFGSWREEFFGGPRVREFEAAWSKRFEVKHSVSVNSATSGLFAAIGACKIEPYDEVIVPPYTMSATAMAPLAYGAIPVFADIEPDTFCLDVRAARRAITPRTRAILTVNIGGHPSSLHELKALCEEHNLFLIEDNAQGPLAKENGKYAGTIADIGVFSLNYHKHIHTGEGGMCCTNDDELALRMQLIRNHGENAVEALKLEDITNLVGFQYRMTELSAAVGLAQLESIDSHVGKRRHIAERLSEGVADLEGVAPPVVREGCEHVYYMWFCKLHEDELGVDRKTFCEALTAEGFPNAPGYIRPLYLLPLFQRRIGYGKKGFPFNRSDVDYSKGICPAAERMHFREVVGFEPCAFALTEEHIDQLIEAFRKVHANRHSLIPTQTF